MSFVDNEDIKAALIAKLKTIPALTGVLASAAEIREQTYQGDEFTYPCVRVRVLRNEPIGRSGCYHRIQFGVQVFSEQQSSKEAEHISGIIAVNLSDAYFSQNSVTLTTRVTNIVPALRTERQTWRSEVLFIATAS